MTISPKPCPRCGDTPVIESLDTGAWRVECMDCHSEGHEDCTAVRATFASAISEWNAWCGDMEEEPAP